MDYNTLVRVCTGALYLGWQTFKGKPVWRQKELLLKTFANHGAPAPKDIRKNIDEVADYYNYRDPAGYASIKDIAFAAFSGYLARFLSMLEHVDIDLESFVINEKKHHPDEVSAINAAQINHLFSTAIDAKTPVRWVSREVLDMLAKTDAPKQIYVGEGFPFKHAFFVYPKDALINLLFFFRIDFEEEENEEPCFGMLIGVKPHSKSIAPFNYLRSIFDVKDGVVQTSDLAEEKQKDEFKSYWDLAFKTLAFCSVEDRIDSISTASLRGFDVVNKAKKGKDTLRNPVWIDVKDPTVIRTTSRGPGSSNHGSPCIHWRSGHFRLQHYGEKRSKTKTIWIRPTLVGAGESA